MLAGVAPKNLHGGPPWRRPQRSPYRGARAVPCCRREVRDAAPHARRSQTAAARLLKCIAPYAASLDILLWIASCETSRDALIAAVGATAVMVARSFYRSSTATARRTCGVFSAARMHISQLIAHKGELPEQFQYEWEVASHRRWRFQTSWTTKWTRTVVVVRWHLLVRPDI